MIKVVEEDLETVMRGGKELNSIENGRKKSYFFGIREPQDLSQREKDFKNPRIQGIDSLDKRLEAVEKDIDELECLSKSLNTDRFLVKARQLTSDICRLGAAEAMRTCIGIQLVVGLHLLSRLQILIDELRVHVRSFKENLISSMA